MTKQRSAEVVLSLVYWLRALHSMSPWLSTRVALHVVWLPCCISIWSLAILSSGPLRVPYRHNQCTQSEGDVIVTLNKTSGFTWKVRGDKGMLAGTELRGAKEMADPWLRTSAGCPPRAKPGWFHPDWVYKVTLTPHEGGICSFPSRCKLVGAGLALPCKAYETI